MLTLPGAARLAKILADKGKRIVFAESCTAGLASASLATVPGISQWHCGSAVTYREQTKADWLGLSRTDIAAFGVVSEFVAEQMARGVLERTLEADVSAAVTGHLGPDAPPELDGVVFIGVARRNRDASVAAKVWRLELQKIDRAERQAEAAGLLLQRAWEELK